MFKAIAIMATIVAIVSYVVGSSTKDFIQSLSEKRDAQISAIYSP